MDASRGFNASRGSEAGDVHTWPSLEVSLDPWPLHAPLVEAHRIVDATRPEIVIMARRIALALATVGTVAAIVTTLLPLLDQ